MGSKNFDAPNVTVDDTKKFSKNPKNRPKSPPLTANLFKSMKNPINNHRNVCRLEAYLFVTAIKTQSRQIKLDPSKDNLIKCDFRVNVKQNGIQLMGMLSILVR